MKKVVLSVLAAFSALLLCAPLSAQKYQPRDTWPYLNEDFEEGAVRTSDGALVTQAKLNVYIGDGSLHYISDGTIMKVDMNKVYTAQIGKFVYLNYMGRMYKVLVESEDGAVLSYTEVDYDAMNKTDIGYGISSSTASSRTTSLVGLGLDAENSQSVLDMDISNVINRRSSGKVLEVKETWLLYCAGLATEANRKDFLSRPGLDRAEAEAFLKKNKVKWNKLNTLLPLLTFINNNQSK